MVVKIKYILKLLTQVELSKIMNLSQSKISLMCTADESVNININKKDKVVLTRVFYMMSMIDKDFEQAVKILKDNEIKSLKK